eukprot:3695476-Lingulodinium_polyedra.AAC.1
MLALVEVEAVRHLGEPSLQPLRCQHWRFGTAFGGLAALRAVLAQHLARLELALPQLCLLVRGHA